MSTISWQINESTHSIEALVIDDNGNEAVAFSFAIPANPPADE